MMAYPLCEAHYWAKQIASRDPEYLESLPGNWEVVQTFDNGGAALDLRVFVPGRELSEDVSSFEWGPRVIAPKGCES